MSIHALSAEPLESAICCSSLAMRSLCASACVGAADCASRTRGEHKRNKANKQRRNFVILLFSSNGREGIGLRDTLASVGRGGKSKKFMGAIRCLILQEARFMKVRIGKRAIDSSRQGCCEAQISRAGDLRDYSITALPARFSAETLFF